MIIQRLQTLLLAMLTAMAASAHDIEVKNSDGVTIYYTFINNGNELAVSYRGNSYSEYSNEYTGKVVIPSSVNYSGKTYSVTSIGKSAFYSCRGLTSVTIPNSVTTIENDAFIYCHGLTSFIIPNSVTSIGAGAFDHCSGLTSVTIPNSVTSIESFAFCGCSDLTSVTIPNSVTSIGNIAFYGCSSLTSINIPNSVTSIGSQAFDGCSGLTSVTIPNSVTSINGYAFQHCSGLKSVTIPNSVTSIWGYAFYDCNNLTDVFCYAKALPNVYGQNTFSSISSATLHVPSSAIDAYRTTAPWSGFGTIVPIEDEEPGDDLQDYLDSFADTEDVLTATSYTRTFKNTQWQALYVPFSLSYSQWSTLFEVARLTGATTEGDNTQIEATLLTADDGELMANTPYLIRAKNTGRYTLNVDASKMADKTESTKVLDQLIAIKGSYSPRTSLRTNGYRCMLGGSLWYPNNSYTLPPYRWYAYPVRLRIVRNISVRIAEGATTAISQQSVCDDDEQTSNRAVYDLSGRRVGNADAVRRLPKGVYMINGRKLIIK